MILLEGLLERTMHGATIARFAIYVKAVDKTDY